MYKRQGKEEQTVKLNRFSCRNLIVDEETKNVYSDGELLELTDTEYAILLLLLKNRHQVFSAERLYEAVWKAVSYTHLIGAGKGILSSGRKRTGRTRRTMI